MKHYVYIITNARKTTLYTGMTSDLNRRLYEHRNRLDPTGFSAQYNLTALVYYEELPNRYVALHRERIIKCKSRRGKEILINSLNPDWIDLDPPNL